MEEDPNDGFQKLNFLLGHPPFPPETFGNLLLLHCKYGYYELAADILAENAHLTFMFLPQVNWSSSSRACMAKTGLVLLLLLHPFLFSCHLFVYFWPSSMHQPNFNMFSFSSRCRFGRWMVALQDLYEFLDASIMVQTSPEEAYRKLVQQLKSKSNMK